MKLSLRRFGHANQQVEDSVVNYVTRVIVLAKADIFEAFWRHDTQNELRISKDNWVRSESMGKKR